MPQPEESKGKRGEPAGEGGACHSEKIRPSAVAIESDYSGTCCASGVGGGDGGSPVSGYSLLDYVFLVLVFGDGCRGGSV